MKTLNVEEKTLLRRFGLDPKQFLRSDKNFENFAFTETKTGKKLLIRR